MKSLTKPLLKLDSSKINNKDFFLKYSKKGEKIDWEYEIKKNIRKYKIQAIKTKIKMFKNENIKSIDLTLYPWFKSLWDIWSVPPVAGEILFFILYTKTVEKSNSGIVKKRKTGAIELYK